MKFLRDAGEYGAGGAAGQRRPALSQDLSTLARPDQSVKAKFGRMSRRTRNLALAAIVPAGLAFVAVAILWPRPEAINPKPPVAPPPAPVTAPVPAGDLRSYALAVPEIKGMPPNAASGTHFELWVAWDPPITDRPKLQRLIDDVVLERVVSPVVPEAPPVAILLVKRREVDELMWGDRYGALSVTARPGH